MVIETGPSLLPRGKGRCPSGKKKTGPFRALRGKRKDGAPDKASNGIGPNTSSCRTTELLVKRRKKKKKNSPYSLGGSSAGRESKNRKTAMARGHIFVVIKPAALVPKKREVLRAKGKRDAKGQV